MKAKKPAPLVVDGWTFAKCEVLEDEFDGSRIRIIRADAYLGDENECRRFSAWLAKAIAWRDAK